MADDDTLANVTTDCIGALIGCRVVIGSRVNDGQLHLVADRISGLAWSIDIRVRGEAGEFESIGILALTPSVRRFLVAMCQ